MFLYPDWRSKSPGFLREASIHLMSVMLLLFLYWLLGVLYENVVAARFSFGGFEAKPQSEQWFQLSLVLASVLLLPARPQRMSQIFVWLSVVFLLLPAAVLSAKQGSDATALVVMFSAVALVSSLCVALSIIFPLSGSGKLLGPIVKVRVVPLVGIQLAVLAMLAWHVRGVAHFSFVDVYDYRFDFNESVSFPLNYLLPFAAGPLAGLIAAGSLIGRRLLLFVYAVICGVLFFGLSSHKAMAFYPLFVLITYFMIRSPYGFTLLILGLIALCIVSLLSSNEVSLVTGSAFANRLMFIPAQIHFSYFEVFDNIGYQLWAGSKISLGLATSTLPIDAVNYIALVMTGDSSIGANTGWIANGYMNAGIVGVVLYAVVLSVILHALDRLGHRYGYLFVGTAFIIPTFNLVNSIDLLAGILTGGLAALFVVFFLFVRRMSGRQCGSPVQLLVSA